MIGKNVSILALALSLSVGLRAEESLMQQEIKHVVILMLENRSFDNVLAWLYEKETPRHFIPANTDPHYYGLSEDTLSLYTNHVKDVSGRIVFSSPPIKGVPSTNNSDYYNSPSTNPHEEFHEVTNQIFGFDGGTQPTMTGFLQDYAQFWPPAAWEMEKLQISAVMETFTEEELPLFYNLAKQYAVCDLWFSSVPTQTNPNRAFTHCGTSEGEIINGPGAQNTFQADTIWNRLAEESPDTTWKIFWYEEMPGVEGAYTGPSTFAGLRRIPNFEKHFNKMDRFHYLARKGKLPDFSFIEPQWTFAHNLFPKKALFEAYADDENEVHGLQGNDFHPPGDVRPVEDLLANIYTSLIANPKAWQETLLIITFDEHGGLFDHVPPPASIAPDERFQHGFKFDRYGVRVPTIFISPKINPGTVIRADHPTLPFDHTSLISTILKWKKIDQSKWNMGKRVDAAPTFEQVITRSEARTDYILKPSHVTLPKIDPNNVIRMGDQFYLRNQNGDYLTEAQLFFTKTPRVGSSKHKMLFSFGPGGGTLTHGSFVTLRSHDCALGRRNMVGTSIFRFDCVYSSAEHDSDQWWTIKNLDCPYVGAEIQYGDRVYLENRTYFDPSQFIPTRLAIDESIFGNFLTTEEITDSESEEWYWIIEKAN
jgi:phospholipase C